jgi:hypothetical protein
LVPAVAGSKMAGNAGMVPRQGCALHLKAL